MQERSELSSVKQERDDLRKQLELQQSEQNELKSRLNNFSGKFRLVRWNENHQKECYGLMRLLKNVLN
jgi:predicted nuclease with TOPRIM domain